MCGELVFGMGRYFSFVQVTCWGTQLTWRGELSVPDIPCLCGMFPVKFASRKTSATTFPKDTFLPRHHPRVSMRGYRQGEGSAGRLWILSFPLPNLPPFFPGTECPLFGSKLEVE